MGIGGIGMSALAQIVSTMGAKVSGCDLKPSSITDRLEQQGIQWFQGHDSSHLKGVDMLVYSSAISDSEEIIRARTEDTGPVS